MGAGTETEMKQKKQMFEDSLNSTKAALESGIVPGGGVALLRASKAIEKCKLSEEEKLGGQVLFKATQEPLRQIAKNAGFDPSIILQDVLKGSKNTGFNMISEEIEDLLKAGIVDPAKIVKNSLSHAVSVAGVVLLSEVLIADAKE